MMRWVLAFLIAILAIPAPAAAQATVRVRIETDQGPIVVALDMRRAPITAKNFLAYAEEKRFDGTYFYRAARNRGDPTRGLVQGGIDSKVRKARWPIDHEPTSKTGISHTDGTISMARNAPGSAMGDFFITVGPNTYLDARDGSPGYAAFGKVVSGMAIVRKMLASPTYPGGRSRATMGQSIVKPIRIISVRKVG